MKREILFRGKTIKGEWVYGDLIHIGGGALIYHGDNQELEAIPQEDSPCAVGFYPNEISPVIHKTVGQFTGLLDKNGKKIFEGDILKHDAFKGTVDYSEKHGQFHASGISLSFFRKGIEIIGNIHDK